MIVGKIAVGATPVAVLANEKWVSIFTAVAELVPKISVYGHTDSTGIVRARAVAYDAATLALLGEGDEVTFMQDLPAQWLDLPFTSNPSGVLFPAANVAFGVHVGDSGLWLYHDGTEAPGGMHNVDAYSDGAAAVFGAAPADAFRMSMFTDSFPPADPVALSGKAYEMVLGRLPFLEAQMAYGATGPASIPSITAEVSWHGSKQNRERGSFATARRGGIFEQYVGRRLELTYGKGRPITVRVYVNDIGDILGDLSVTRRVYAQFAPLGFDSITAQVKVLKEG